MFPLEMKGVFNMSLMDEIKGKARSDKKVIVLAEGNEPRTVAAAAIVKKEAIADVILLGDEAVIRAAGDIDIDGITIINPEKKRMAGRFYGNLLRDAQSKGNSPWRTPLKPCAIRCTSAQ